MGSVTPDQEKKTPEIILGAIQFGHFPHLAGRPAPFSTVESITPILDAFQSRGYSKVDTARIYGGGASESLLAEADWQKRGLHIETKLFPTKSRPLGPQNVPYSFTPEDLRAGLQASLDALKSEKVDTFYLYAPDRTVPLEASLREVHALYKAGRFTRWGMCNFPAWEVALINELCIRHDFVRPTVYQGIYNALLRSTEPELVPCLRHYGMSFEAGQPIASGLLTDRYHRDMKDDEHEAGRRFDPNHFIGRHIRERYWFEAYFDAVEIIKAAAAKEGLSVLECSLRWLKWHSVLKGELGDAIVVGASDLKQLEEQLLALEKGPLSEEIVKAFEEAWGKAKRQVWQYHN